MRYTIRNEVTDTARERVTLCAGKEYEVEFYPCGRVRVWTLFAQQPFTKSGAWRSDQGARELRPDGPTALRVIALAGDQIEMRLAFEALRSGEREW